MRIKEKRKEWKIYFLTRRDLLQFTEIMNKRYGDCKITISPADDGNEIAWIPKNTNITREQIVETAMFLNLI